ncbi:TonB-dependent receptor plug domain-containing protein [Ekhidna sp. MALMAid0563]|uniref:TonB-dependent receptor plug domain-containing protein n=1 Tax=Ekhidna sp. MALMAid0563 TaxID=3143937 RepID=UPI0032DE4369
MRILIFCTTILTSLSVFAQIESKLFFEAVADYEESIDITFSYDAELLSLIEKEALFTSSDLSTFIAELEGRFPLAVEKISDEYYTISAQETTYQLVVKDSLDGLAIDQSFGVQVVINDAPVPTRFKDGHWEFSYKPDQKDNIIVFSQGYQSTSLSVKELFNRKVMEVKLGLTTRRLSTVVVEDYLTKGINMLPSKQQIQIDINDLPLLPGETDGDIFASIAALPGITNPDSRAGNIFIRGSDTDQTLILFDNIPVYHRGHYYGTISPYNPKVVDDVEVYRSGFHPRFGDRVGGAIVINSDDAGQTTKYGLGANTLFGMGYSKFRISDKLSGTLGIRNSYPRSFKSPKLNEISESVFAATSLVDQSGLLTERIQVAFSDYNGKLSYQINKNHNLGLSAIHTVSDINFRPVVPLGLPSRSNDNRYENTGVNLSWNSIWDQGWSSELNTTYSNYDFEFTIKTMAPDMLPFNSNNSIDDLNVVQEFSKESDYSNLQIGLDYKWQHVTTNYQNMLRDSSFYTLYKSVSSYTIAPYANYEYYGLEKWYFQLGVRSTYYSALDDFSVSPRVLINYDLTDWVTLKGSHGWYNQYLSQVKNLEYSSGGFDNELWVLADNESGFIIRGAQTMVGGVVNVNDWIFDVEGFFKTANNVTIFEDRVLNPDDDFQTMDQETYGVDILLKKQLTAATSIWTGYSYHDSKITIDTTDQVIYESKYVQPHVWYIGAAFKMNRWKLSAAWRYASGLNAYSLDIAYAESIFKAGPPPGAPPPPPGTPPPPNPFIDVPDRYPSVHSLDLSASYKIPQTDQRKWSASFGVSIINALNRNNLTDRVYRSRDGFVDREAIGFAPNLMVIVEW